VFLQVEQETAGENVKNMHAVSHDRRIFPTDGSNEPSNSLQATGEAQQSQLRASGSLRLVVLHGAHNVSFRVLKEDKSADSGNVKLRHNYLPAIGFHRGDRFIDLSHAKAAFKSEHWFARNYLPSTLQRSLHSRVFVGSGFNQEKSWRTPRGKPPTESFLIETARAIDIVGMYGKVFDVIRHRLFSSCEFEFL
jgi:hypothetical protein